MNYEKKNARFTGILVLLVLTTSCATHFTYIVNPQIIPNFSKANETMIAGSISCQDDFTNFGHINLAHSISDKQAFVGGLSYLTSNTQVTSNYWGKEVTAYYASIGFGNYKRIGSGKILENYSGIGQGSILNEQSKFEIGNTTHKRRSYDLQYLSIYNQTSFSTISKNKWMTTILSVRFSGQYHYKILLNNFDIYYFQNLKKESFSIFIQPSVQVRIGKGKLKGTAYFTTDIDTNPPEDKAESNFLNFPTNPQPILGFGLVYGFN